MTTNNQDFEARLAGLKKGKHRHFCLECQTLWQHTGVEITNRHKAHSCPGCGAYVTELFLHASDLQTLDWDGTEESPKAKLSELRRRDEFEKGKTRRIYFRVYWLTKNK